MSSGMNDSIFDRGSSGMSQNLMFALATKVRKRPSFSIVETENGNIERCQKILLAAPICYGDDKDDQA